MSKRVIVNASKQQNERIINHNIDNMSGGMVSDVEPTEIPPNALYHLENAVGFPDRLEGRRGSALFSDRRLPVEDEYSVTVADGVVTTNRYWGDVVGKILCFWEDGYNFSTRITGVIDDFTVETDSDVTIETTTVAGLRGNINGSFFDNTQNKIILIVGVHVYISELAYSKTGAEMSEWVEISPINSGFTDSMCNIHMINDVTFINNETGVFRLDTNKGYMWKCNVGGPLLENKIKEVNYVDPLEYGYRYMYTYSRFIGKSDENRLNGIIEHETCPNNITDPSQTDFSTVYNSLPNGYTSLSIGVEFDTTNHNEKEAYYWKELDKSALKIEVGDINDAVLGNRKVEYVYFDFSGVVTFLDIFKVLNDGFKSCSCVVDISYINTQDGIRMLYIYGDDIIIKEVKVFDLLDVEGVYDSSYDLFLRMDCSTLDIGVSSVDGVTKTKVEGLKNTSLGLTHYSVYRTYDVSGFENNDDVSYRSRPINDPNVYTWVGDVPMMEVINVVIDGTTLKTDITHTRNIGCYISIASTSKRITGIVSDGYTVGTTTGWVDGADVGVIGRGAFTQVGYAELTLMSLGYALNPLFIPYFGVFEVGSVIFWDDGEVDIVKFVNPDIDLVVIADRKGGPKPQRNFAVKPGERDFNDTTSDFVLESRNRTLPLKNRFFIPMSDKNNLSVLIPGFLITSEKNKGSFEYCSTSDLSHIGYRHQIIQVNDFIDTDIQSVSWVNGVVSIKTSHSTFVFDPQQAFDAGDPRFNESVFALTDPIKVNDTIGVTSPKYCITVKDGLELVYTNEPGVRFYNGREYGEDISNNKVFLSYIIPFHENVILDYDNSLGIIMWGKNE
jgi:hypothetical protein